MQRNVSRSGTRSSGRGGPARFAIALAALVIACGVARDAGAITTPLHVGTWQSIVDEFGVKLEGQAYVGGDLVQILHAASGVIHPPGLDGTPHPGNPPLAGGTTHIGALSSPSLVNEGIFAASIAHNRPGNGAQVFVRAFNAPTLAGASFYGDSEIFTVKGNDVFEVRIAAVDTPLDTRDPDGDGLHNSWEKSYGTDPDRWDSDRDGMGDGDEIRAGTNPLDEHCLLILAGLSGDGGTWQETDGTNVWDVVRYTDVTVQWPSVVGKQYRVQFSADYLTENPAYVDVSAVVTATDTTTFVVIPDGLLLGQGTFRVRLVEE